MGRGPCAVGRGPWSVGCGLWAVGCGRELWAVGCDLRSTKAKATELLIESFHRAENATEMRKSVDALCKLHGLIK